MSTFDPAKRPYRFTVLAFAAFILFGSYFAYDSVGALVDALMKRFGVGREEIGATYTMYSLAAIPTVFFGGWLVDRLGTRRASLLFSGFVTVGSVVVAVAPSLTLLYLGRLIFGMGSESLVVAQSDLPDKAVANCIAASVKLWVFPKPEGGGNVVVTYPFVLEPG